MISKDYYRAITEWKRVNFESTNPDEKKKALYGIAESYYKSHKNKHSIKYLSRLMNKFDLTQEERSNTSFLLGMNYYDMKLYPMARQYFEQAEDFDVRASFNLGYIDLELGKYDVAKDKFNEISEKSVDQTIIDKASFLSDYSEKGKNLRKKKPFIAGTLSAIIPGAGQLYSTHSYDAGIAFSYVSAFIYGSYLAYQYDKTRGKYSNTIICVSLTSVFHFANILGATKTANYYNHRQKTLYMIKAKKMLQE